MEDFVRYSCNVCGELMASEALEVIPQTDSRQKFKEPWTKADAWDLAHYNGQHIAKEVTK